MLGVFQDPGKVLQIPIFHQKNEHDGIVGPQAR